MVHKIGPLKMDVFMHILCMHSEMLTFSQVMALSSTLFRVVHLHPMTTFEAHALCALYLQIPQLYPEDVTPKKSIFRVAVSH